MRMMMTASLDTEACNAGIRNGKLMTTIQKMMAALKPEAAYFTTDSEGRRSAIVVFDMKDPSQIPGVAEPLFLGLNAAITFRPVMTVQDLAAAGPAIEQAVKES